MGSQEFVLTHPEEYSLKADELRKNRIEQSYYKYGTAKKNFGKHYVNAIETSELCVNKYWETGNTEYLLDAMNYLMFEYMYPSKEGAFFKATGSEESVEVVGFTVNQIKQEVENG